jgi:hypothetical protein
MTLENSDTPQKPKRKNKPGAGRPFRTDIDEAMLVKLARIHCTMKEIAACLDCSVDLLERNYAELIKKSQSEGKASLRRMQYLCAEKGNVGMMIWLGKQLLGQVDASVLAAAVHYQTEDLTKLPHDELLHRIDQARKRLMRAKEVESVIDPKMGLLAHQAVNDPS